MTKKKSTRGISIVAVRDLPKVEARVRFSYSAMKKPYVLVCTAVSFDGKISNHKKEQIEVAENDDKDLLYETRIITDAVMIGGNTLRLDDSGLTVKTDERRKSRKKLGKTEEPVKVVVISDMNKLKAGGSFFDRGNAEKIIFTTKKTSNKKINEFEKKARVYTLGKNKVNLTKVMEILYNLGIRHLMVEGGGILNFALLKENLIDEIKLKIGNLIVGGEKAKTFMEGQGFDLLTARKVKFKKIITKPNYIIIQAFPKK